MTRARAKLRERVRQQAQIKSPAEILRELEQTEHKPPPRSTVYAWVKEARDELARDGSGRWLLATDRSGRPELVLRVQAAVLRAQWSEAEARVLGGREPGVRGGLKVLEEARSGPQPPPITHEDAKWIAKLGAVMPEYGTDDREILDLLFLARQYVAAEGRGDVDELAVLDATVAVDISRKE